MSVTEAGAAALRVPVGTASPLELVGSPAGAVDVVLRMVGQPVAVGVEGGEDVEVEAEADVEEVVEGVAVVVVVVAEAS